ncbi:hypothetical protein [Clostridium intestinale]|uniref:hypothetical protein n=1 Tax=Clostridium intestinale TaxID=36845 RepID=UPI002DD685E4|nr:hypothetical protein [Clostridium intestinale]WRY50716.1 hypothetical protein P8F83_18920 [Clostridium intestinale]
MFVRVKNTLSLLLLCFVTLGFLGCTNTEKEEQINSSETTTESNTSSNIGITKKEFNLLDYIGKSSKDLENDFGKPIKIDNTELGQLYIYDSINFSIDDDKVIVISVKDAESTINVNGVTFGMTPKDIKAKIGEPTKETNSNGFIMEYRLNNNTISLQYYCDDFRSPISLITVTDLTFGKEKPMEVTKEQVNQLMNGTWILEKNIYEENLSFYKHIFSNGIMDIQLSEHLQKKYEVTSYNALIIRGETLNGFGSTEYLEAEFFIEFFDNGDKMVIYHLDEVGDKDSEDMYVRYN